MTASDEVPTFDAAKEREIDRAAAVTPEDVDRAKVQWAKQAPKAFRRILDAKEEP